MAPNLQKQPNMEPTCNGKAFFPGHAREPSGWQYNAPRSAHELQSFFVGCLLPGCLDFSFLCLYMASHILKGEKFNFLEGSRNQPRKRNTAGPQNTDPICPSYMALSSTVLTVVHMVGTRSPGSHVSAVGCETRGFP